MKIKQAVLNRDEILNRECVGNYYFIQARESRAGIKYINLKKVPQSPIDYEKMADEANKRKLGIGY